jgi:hypothetical protein
MASKTATTTTTTTTSYQVNDVVMQATSTSQKHKDFVSEPMGEKDITEIAGIGKVLGQRLTEKGYDRAYVLLGQFLVLKKDEENFKDWLKETCGANSLQASNCFECLNEWCNSYI